MEERKIRWHKIKNEEEDSWAWTKEERGNIEEQWQWQWIKFEETQRKKNEAEIMTKKKTLNEEGNEAK